MNMKTFKEYLTEKDLQESNFRGAGWNIGNKVLGAVGGLLLVVLVPLVMF